MDFVAMIEQCGLRVLNGQRRVQAALSVGQQVMACDGEGAVYRISIEDNALVVQELPGQQADGSMIIVAPVEPKTLH
jgi:hypothetical protein